MNKPLQQNSFTSLEGKSRHILLWLIATLYLLLSPSLSYHFFVQEGKPIEVWELPPEETGRIRYNIESLKYWSKNMEIFEEGETYALWGWAFLDARQNIGLADFDRFVILCNHTRCFVLSSEIYPRPDVQEAFKDLELNGLASSGFYSVISKNALPLGEYSIGLLFKHRAEGQKYYVETGKILTRTPNHLLMNSISK